MSPLFKKNSMSEIEWYRHLFRKVEFWDISGWKGNRNFPVYGTETGNIKISILEFWNIPNWISFWKVLEQGSQKIINYVIKWAPDLAVVEVTSTACQTSWEHWIMKHLMKTLEIPGTLFQNFFTFRKFSGFCPWKFW